MNFCFQFRERLASLFTTLGRGILIVIVCFCARAFSQTGSAISVDTQSGYSKSNQSKVFYHDGKWWAIAFDTPSNRWQIWKYESGSWTKMNALDKGTAIKYDALVSSAAGKLYAIGSHHSVSKFWRFSYSSGTWTKDAGFDVDAGFVNTNQVDPISLIRAKNGELWLFRFESNTLQGKRSTDGGLTWPAVIDVKTGLTTATGQADAVAFSSGGNDYVGVAYAESNTAGSKYGFLIHRDGDPETTWTDETASLTFFGSERADGKICAATDNDNNVYLFTQNANASGGDPRNTLYKRSSAGAWSKFAVNTTADWKSPGVVADVSNNKIFLVGTNTATSFVEYKSCLVGQESTLNSATATELLAGPGAVFNNISAPAPSINASSSLMVCGENTAANDIWFNLLNLEPITVGAVTVVSNEVNANASYTIALTLGGNGALGAGTGVINFAFPVNTLVPSTMTASEVLVDGTPATTVITNSTTRQVSVTTPINLPDNYSFSVVFNTGAGLLNPSIAGNYTLNGWTSVQLSPAASSAYLLSAATTTVTPATVSMSTSEPDSCANYTISFNLGAHGRMLSGTSTFTVTFDPATTIANGALSGVAVNGTGATATGDNTTKTVTITLPAAVTLNNNAAVALYIPAPGICNPSVFGTYTATVATSVETTPVTSNPYKIIERVNVGAVTVTPADANVIASYTIPLTLASAGALTAGVDMISVRFPDGTTVPASITPSQVVVDGTPATTVVSNSLLREVHVTVPVNLPNSHNFSVVFNLGAGILNPAVAGDYTLLAWTSVQTTKVTSPIYTLTAGPGSAISVDTKSGLRKSNQSKVFFYDSQWWAIAFYEPNNRWYIWKYTGTTWVRTRDLEKGTGFNFDAVLHSGTGKLFLIGSHKTTSRFRRYSYAGGTWNKDSGFPINLPDFPNTDTGNPLGLVRANNGDLWLFRIDSGILQAKHSTNSGLTWSVVINLKTGLPVTTGTTDAVAFSAGVDNYVGVAYGLTSPPAGTPYGFLIHRDGDPNTTWTDETASLTFFGNETSFNNLSMTTDPSNNVYLFTRNINATGSNPRNTLYKRTSAGVWEKHKVNALASLNWKTPAIAIDATNNRIYVMGVNTNTNFGEYKTCPIGQESTLEAATVADLFSGTGATFDDLSAPAANVDGFTGLMMCADNTAASDIWYRHLPIAGSSPLIVGTVTAVMNEVNSNATYTVPLTLSANGALGAGVGVINFRFPDNTHIPNTMPANAVIVDGTPATTVIANQATRQVSVTTPVNLPNNYLFTVVFDSAAGAGILNPTTVGINYKLTVWSSAQPAQVQSPPFTLVQATTKVTPATVTPFPTDPDSLADYTLSFNLGAHGRLLSGLSTIMVKFGPATAVTEGILSGAKVNLTNATAAGNSALRQVTVTLPASVSLTNNSAVTVFLPKAAIHNPILAGNYTLTVATSVETTMVASLPYEIKPSTNIGKPIPGTTKRVDRNNQSKMFYHGGYWWVTAQSKADLKWYLWKFDGLLWTQSTLLHNVAKNRPDCVLDAANNKVYILLPGSSTTYFTRLSYSGGNWTVDSGYPYSISDFEQSGDRGIPLVRANNGDWWIFVATDSTLLAKRSSNDGQTWSATITVKDSLNNYDALTDAVAFTYSGGDYVGVGYAENSAPGSVYGFLRHEDGDPDATWTDETGAIPQFANTTSDDHISMTVNNNEVLMVVKTNGGGPTTTNIGLLQRETDGSWTQYPIFLSTGWTRPALAIDESNDRLYAVGAREGPVKVGEVKSVALGDYGSLLSAPVDTIFKNNEEVFFNTSVAAHPVNGTMNLLVCNGNETRDELWYNLVTLGGIAKSKGEEPVAQVAVEEDLQGVQVYPNPFNPYTLFRFKVREAAPVKLQIFNVQGQLVRTLIDRDMLPGVHVQRWNGHGKNGHPAASGMYFYRLQIGKQTMTGRIQMIK